MGSDHHSPLKDYFRRTNAGKHKWFNSKQYTLDEWHSAQGYR